ncbi:MAG: RidA family protein [Methyloligellaceae bacterium]
MVRSISPANVPHHKNPIPAAAIHKNVLASSAISGIDPNTGEFPENKEEQVALAYEHLNSILNEAGAKPQDIVKMDLYFADKSDRSLVNKIWLELFPDADARPARHAHSADLQPGCIFQIEILAILDNRS